MRSEYGERRNGSVAGRDIVIAYLRRYPRQWVRKQDVKFDTGVEITEELLRSIEKTEMIAMSEDNSGRIMWLGEDESLPPDQYRSSLPPRDTRLDADPSTFKKAPLGDLRKMVGRYTV